MADSAPEDLGADETSRLKAWAKLILCFAWAFLCFAGLLTARPTFNNRGDWQTIGGAFICSAIGFNQWHFLRDSGIKTHQSDNNVIRLLSWASFICALLIVLGTAVYYLSLLLVASCLPVIAWL